MIIKIVYNSDLHNKFYYELLNKLHDITIETYDMKYTTDAKKGFKVKGTFGARLEPFVGLYTDEEKILKGFYSEASQCTIDSIINYLDNECKNG